MTPLQAEAHKRMLEVLPVRTHELPKEPSPNRGGRTRTAEECAVFARRVKQLEKKGWSVRKMSRHLRVTRQTIYNYLNGRPKKK